ncbi:MAG TPA: type II CAAX endopeptidase family protein [Mycobacteriales bacterium]|nr:type II CAAX endopeptidase family protein [Mycobacteriales bacterium]
MKVRAQGLVVGACVVSGLFGLLALGGTASQTASAGGRAVSGVIGIAAVALAARLIMVGLSLEPYSVTIRTLTTTSRFTRAEVLGLASQPALGGRVRRLVVVCADGRVVPSPWTLSRSGNRAWAASGAWAAAGFGPTQEQVAPTLSQAGRLIEVDELPVATAEPGLAPQTVAPLTDAAPLRWIGWETGFVVAAFALPGVAAAVEILSQHLEGVSNLNEFALPLPHNPAASLFILILGYLTTALVVPIALLLLARTGQPPKTLGLDRPAIRRDLVPAVGLLAGVFAANVVVVLAFSHVINNKHLANTATNSHVPAYYVVYALVVSATTAINEEVVVNGYFMTRLSQLGWSPWRAFALSLAVRTSYHAYYGVGLIATIPFGYLVTRSFQKHRRLARPILAHFLYDATLLTIAVLTS